MLLTLVLMGCFVLTEGRSVASKKGFVVITVVFTIFAIIVFLIF